MKPENSNTLRREKQQIHTGRTTVLVDSSAGGVIGKPQHGGSRGFDIHQYTSRVTTSERQARNAGEKKGAVHHQMTKHVLFLGITGCCLLMTTRSALAVPPRVIEARAGIELKAPVLAPAGQNVFKRKPRTLDEIKWGWLVEVDGVGTPAPNTSSEQKFTFIGSGAGRIPVAVAKYGGFSKTKTGNSSTQAQATGTGSSTINAGNRRPYQVDFNVTATSPFTSATSHWFAKANASDPFHIIGDDLIEGGFSNEVTVDITFPVGLTSASFQGGDLGIAGEESSIAFDVGLDLNGTPYSIFSLFTDFDGVLAPAIDFASMPFDVTIHQLAALDDDPVPGVTDITIGEIRSLLTADFADGSLDTPLLLAFELRNVAVSEIMAGGAILSANLEGRAAGVPEPATLALLALGGPMLLRRRR